MAAALKVCFVTESEFNRVVDRQNPMIQYDNIIALMRKTAFAILIFSVNSRRIASRMDRYHSAHLRHRPGGCKPIQISELPQ
jgi:hypothetical protein